jgi:hypothetical protein
MSHTTLRVNGGVVDLIVGILLPSGHLLSLGGDSASGTTLGETTVLMPFSIAVFLFIGSYLWRVPPADGELRGDSV